MKGAEHSIITGADWERSLGVARKRRAGTRARNTAAVRRWLVMSPEGREALARVAACVAWAGEKSEGGA